MVKKTYFPHSVHKECPGENAFSFSAVVRVESFFFPLLRILPVTSKLLSIVMLPVKKGATKYVFNALLHHSLSRQLISGLNAYVDYKYLWTSFSLNYHSAQSNSLHLKHFVQRNWKAYHLKRLFHLKIYGYIF